MTELNVREGKLFAGDHEVLRGWESYTGWYWFAVEKIQDRKITESGAGGSFIKGKAVDDTIWYGLVQGIEEEWGDFSQAEIESLGKLKVWEIPNRNLPISGRRG